MTREPPMPHDARGRRHGGSDGASTASADTLRFPLAVAAVHWVIVQLAASLAYHVGTPNATVSPPYRTMPSPLTGLAHVLVEPLRQWDGLWYKLIAEKGYAGGFEGQIAKAAFWPLYPWLMNLGSHLIGWTVDSVGYLIANVSFAVTLVLLYRLVALDFDREVARRTLWAIALFPTAFFFSAVYTESLFLMLAVGALLAARLGHWWVAGVAGVLGALTRSSGVLLLIPFAVLFLQQYRRDPRRWFPNLIPAALPALGPAIFGWHLAHVQGNWRAFIDVQTQWNRYGSPPWETLRCAATACYRIPGQAVNSGADWGWVRTLARHPSWTTLTTAGFRIRAADSDTLELVCTLLFLALAVVGLRTLPLYQSAFLIPGLIIPLYQPSQVHALMSMPRFGLTLFPLFVVLAQLVRGRLAVVLLAPSALLLVVLTVQFADWYWVS